MTAHALVRAVPDSFERCVVRAQPRPKIDVALAREQHRAYVEAIEQYGIEVVELPADESFPDCPFVEDTAVIVGKTALLTVPGEASRRGETEAVAAALARFREVVRMSPPATLDGGDVLRIETTLFVGRSRRTNAAGIAELERVAAREGFRVVPVTLRDDVLHLKSVVTAARPRLLVAAKGAFDEAPFQGREIVYVDASEPAGCNVLPVDNAVLVSASAPRLEDALRHRGVSTIRIEHSEFEKGDGGLTCSSILIP